MPQNKFLAKIHIVKKDLDLDDDSYRASLEKSTGKRSAALMDEREIIKAIHDLVAKGRDPYKPSPEILHKIETMWHDLYRGNEEKKHLRQFLFNHFKVSDLNFLDRRKAYEAVEALKAMKHRRGA